MPTGRRNQKGARLKTPTLLLLLCALLSPIPLLVSNPDFANGSYQYAGVLVAFGFVAGLLIGAGKILNRILGGRVPGLAFALGFLFLLAGAVIVGWIVGGAWVAAVNAAPFLIAAGLYRFSALGKKPENRHSLMLLASIIAFSLTSLIAFRLGHPARPDTQVLMIGLDGATWEIVDSLRSEGRLPVVDELIKTGSRAELDTLVPIISPPIWTSIASGRTPDHHGIKDFWASSSQVQVKRLWELVDERGGSSGVLGYLVTWPPMKESGFLVPGWLAQDAATFPAELSFLKDLEIRAKTGDLSVSMTLVKDGLLALRHGLTLSTMTEAAKMMLWRKPGAESDRHRSLAVRLVHMRLKTDVFCHLMRRLQPSLGIVYFNATDAVQHLFFKYYEPTNFPELTEREIEEFGDAVPGVYELADRSVERILDAVGPSADIVVASDHGQKSTQADGYSWFEISSSRLLKQLGLEDQLKATKVGRSVLLRPSSSEIEPTGIAEMFESIATTSDGEPFFVFERRAEGEGLVSVRNDFDPDVHTDILMRGEILASRDFVFISNRVSGEHTDTAMLLMSGPRISADRQLPRGSVLDIAPTVLYLLGIPLARDLDGRLLDEAIDPTVLQRNAVTYVETYGKSKYASDQPETDAFGESALEELKALGYVD